MHSNLGDSQAGDKRGHAVRFHLGQMGDDLGGISGQGHQHFRAANMDDENQNR